MADVLTYDSAYLAGLRDKIVGSIAYARYKVGSTWHKAKVGDAKVLPNGKAEVTFTIDHTVAGDITVTAIELYDKSGALVCSKSVSIRRTDATEGIIYVCRFNVLQVVANSDNKGGYDGM